MNYMVFKPSYSVGNPGIGDGGVELIKNELGRFDKKQDAIDFIYSKHEGKYIYSCDDNTRFMLDDGEGNRYTYGICEVEECPI